MTSSKQLPELTHLNFIDVFSGAGGLSCGMELAGLRCLLGIDHDKHALDTFAANHHFAKTYVGPVEILDGRKLNKLLEGQTIHAVVGGPPCQGFSTVGRGDPKDLRNKLFLHFVRLVKHTRPYFIIIENVTGLLAQKNESTLKAILGHFTEMGYNLGVQVMSAETYGVPERRRRTIIIGSRINANISFPQITHGEGLSKPLVTVGQAFADLRASDGQIYNHDVEASELKDKMELKRLKLIPEGRGIRYKQDEEKYLPTNLRLGVNWEKMRENRFRQTKYQRLDRQQPSPTIMTHRHNYYHPVEHRFLTQREAAVLQSFPTDFIFKGPLSAQWRQIGNAVPPLLGKALGGQLLALYQEALLSSKGKKSSMTLKGQYQNIKKIRGEAFLYKE